MFYYEPIHETSNLYFKTDYNFCHRFPLHFHRHLELHYCLNGYKDIEISNKQYRQPEGAVSLIFPYQPHQFGKGDGFSTHIIAIVNIDYLEPYTNTLLTMLPENPIITSDKLPACFRDQIIHAHNRYVFPGKFHLEICGSMLSAIIGEVLSAMNLIEIDEKKYNRMNEKPITRILEYCTKNATKNITLDSVSNALFLNKHYVSHIFSDKIGIPFNTFINTHRIYKVCTLLKSTNDNILDIAYECGFHNQGTFNRVFKEYMKMSPTEYRNSIHRHDTII
ncbi:MAG: AraC family transcriptional regulator [Clostridia bacterium]|nr:AraC family transcriptional regulator [Clostridia bacterium]